MAKGIQKIYQKPPSSPSRWSSPPSTRMVNVHPRSHTLLIHFLLFVCALSCFFFHFTDSFHGTVYYGFVTPLWPSRRMIGSRSGSSTLSTPSCRWRCSWPFLFRIIGSPIAFPPGREKDMEQVRESFLLLVTRNKSLYLWDLFNKTCLLHDSLASLIASSPNSSSKDVGTIYYLHMFWIGQLCFYENFSYALVSIIFYIFFFRHY